MGSSTFKGRYKECFSCIHQFYDEVKKDYNCKYSHSIIRKNANGEGVKYKRVFTKLLKLKQIKGEE